MRLYVYLLFLLGFMGHIEASTIIYKVDNVVGNEWEYSYTVDNDTLSNDIEEFTIYFPHNSYDNLVIGATPNNWDSLAVQPDNVLPADGFYDSVALSEGILSNTSLSDFTIRFTYLLSGTPGSQLFEIIDPDTFNVLDSGTTSLATVSTVIPLPDSVLLFMFGAIFLFFMQRRKHCEETLSIPY